MWTLLLGLFWADATITLLRRMIRRERFWEAHRTHFYQQAIQAGWSHKKTALVCAGVNLVLIALAWALGMWVG